MAILYSDNFSSYLSAADMENYGWTINGETGGDPSTVLNTTGGPFGSGDYSLRFRDFGGSSAVRDVGPTSGNHLRIAMWVKTTAGAQGEPLAGSTGAFAYVSTTASSQSLWGLGLSTGGGLRCPYQWDDSSHGMGGAPKINDGEWHHIEGYIKVDATDGLVFLWVDDIFVFSSRGNTMDAATTLADLGRVWLSHPNFQTASHEAEIAHFVMWTDDEDSNSVNDLSGRIGPHRVENDGSVTTGQTVPTSYDFGLTIGLEPFDFANLSDSNSLPGNNQFDITFSDIPDAYPLLTFGFSNTALAYDTVSAGGQLNWFAADLTHGGMWGTTKSVDNRAAGGSGANRAHREGTFGDFSSSIGIYLSAVSAAEGSSATILEVEAGSGNLETSLRSTLGVWNNLAVDVESGGSSAFEIMAIANEMLDGVARYGANINTDPVTFNCGFDPDFILTFGVNDTAQATGGSFFGSTFGAWAANGGTPAQRCIMWGHQSSSTTANNIFYHEIANDHCYGQIDFAAGTKTYEVAASVSSGVVTLNPDNTNTDVLYALAIKLRGGRKSKLIDFSTPTATGDQAVTGLGFTPGFLWLFLLDDDEALNSIGSNLATGMLVSMMRSNRQVCLNFSVDPDVAPTVCKSYKSEKAIKFYDAIAAAVSLEASLTSFDADGFTLNWTTVKGVACRGYILAIEGDAAESSNSLDSNSNSNDPPAAGDSFPIFFVAAA